MASTPEQVQQSLNVLFEGWISKFTPLYLPVREMKRLMFKRIFGTGSSGGTNSEGQKLPTVPYSTTPIYVSPRSLTNAPAKFKFGKPPEGETRGKPIESLYFPNGYAQLKKETSRKLPLELTGRLKGGFLSEDVITEGLTAAIALPESEKLKAQGLQFGNGRGLKGYGIIFQPTGFEQDKMLEEHIQLIAEQITNAMNKQ
jgi:hypothetical protein